jgi:pimeloyl-ACP methyl ester carboxylesterase
MLPLWFGPAPAQRFGWYHAPEGQGSAVGTGVVICPPLGYEDVCCYRAMRALAIRLSAAGFPVMRFEYHGTGDSTGDDAQPGRVPAWLESIGLAADALKAASGVTQVHLFGVRVGATLAAVAAAERTDVASLVLWAPLPSGRAYVREMKMLRLSGEEEYAQAPAGVPPGRGEGDEEAGGFLVSAETLAALGALDLKALPRAPAPEALLLAREDLPRDERLAAILTKLGTATTQNTVPGYVAMMRDPHRTSVPTAVFDEVVGWIAAHAVPSPAPVPGRGVAAVGSPALELEPERLWPAGAREEAVVFGGSLRMFGILTRPRAPAPDGGKAAVVMLNAGGVRRIGPSRLYVHMARAWTAHGITSFRVDLTGLGDSAGGDDPSLYMYSQDAVAGARAVLAFLREQGFERFLLLGLCSGAYVSFHTAIDEPSVATAVMLNPQTFFWKEGDSLDVGGRRKTNFDETHYYLGALWRAETWKKVLSGGVELRSMGHAARAVAGRTRIVAWETLGRVGARLLGREDEVLTAFRRLVARDIEALMVYSQGDQGLDYIEAHLGKGIRQLGSRHRLTVQVIEGPDHTFTPLWSQQHLVDVLTPWVAERLSR